MTREQYIENIKGRLGELTKDELKDINILTNSQLTVRQAVAEKVKLMNEITELKSQLEDAKKANSENQKPEVPQFVADWYEENKGDLEHNVWKYIRFWDHQEKDDFYHFMDIFGSIEIIFAMKKGYTVVNEKKYLLKHKSVVVHDGECEESDVDELYLNAEGNFTNHHYNAKIFTQSEIYSMDTGSYEQIEVQE